MKDKYFNCTYYNCNLRSYLFATGFYWESLTSNFSHHKRIVKLQRERNYMKRIRMEKMKCKLSWRTVYLWKENMLIEKEILELKKRKTKKSENLLRNGSPIILLSTSFSTNSEDWKFRKSLSCKPIRLTQIFWKELTNNSEKITWI